MTDAPPNPTVFKKGMSNPPTELHGVPLKSWKAPADWSNVSGQAKIDEPPLHNPGRKKVSTGLIMHEPDGRVWLTRPTNGFGGYKHTFPKGGLEKGLSMQANAIKEAHEETGLKGRITGHATDAEGDTSLTRYYHAVREGGHPLDHGWESEAVVLAHPQHLHKFLNRQRDIDIAEKHLGAPTSRWKETSGQEHPVSVRTSVKNAKITNHRLHTDGAHAKLQETPEDLYLSGLHTDKTREGSGRASAIVRHATGHADATGKTLELDAQPYGGRSDSGRLKRFYERHGFVCSPEQWREHKMTYDPGRRGETAMGIATGVRPKPAAPATPAAPTIPDATKWKRVGPQMGSNPGGVFHDEGGKPWYVKRSRSDDHARNENLANHLYRRLGVPVPDHQLVTHGGRLGTASPMMRVRPFDPDSKDDIGKIRKHFAAHALLSNWDTIGLDNDNQVHSPKGMTTIDAGGSLNYRAQGAPKGPAFGHEAGEWDTLRGGGNEQAAHVFGGMKPHELVDSARAVGALPDHEIHGLVHEHGPGGTAEKDEMASKLVARKNDIVGRANALAAKHGLNPVRGVEQASISVERIERALTAESAAVRAFAALNDVERRAYLTAHPGSALA